MSIRAKVVLFAICLTAASAFGAETYETFAKESLGLDLKTLPLGTAVETNNAFAKTDAPISGVGLPEGNGLTWMVNDVSAKYKTNYPNRMLKYGFRDGKVAAVRISISAFGGPGFAGGNSSQEEFAERRKELIKIHEAFAKVRKGEMAAPNSSRYYIRYGAMCAPTPESLFLMEFQITRDGADIAFPPAGSGLDIHPQR
jgi:hypothetical protein